MNEYLRKKERQRQERERRIFEKNAKRRMLEKEKRLRKTKQIKERVLFESCGYIFRIIERYIQIHLPVAVKGSKWVFYHQYILNFPKGVIHHKDKNPKHNCPHNLEVHPNHFWHLLACHPEKKWMLQKLRGIL